MKILYLNGILTIPNEVGEDKISQAREDRKSNNKPNWAELGLNAPKDELQYDEEGRVLLDEEDLEDVYTSVNIILSSYAGAEDSLDGGCTVHTKHRLSYRVAETADEVASYVEMLDMNYLHRNYVFLKARMKENLNSLKNLFNKQQINN